MSRLVQTEIWKLKRYSIIWIGVATMLSVVLLTCFMEIGTPGTPAFSTLSDHVIWNNFSLIFPATITLISGYIIERERTDDTLKNLKVIPISFRKLLIGKIIVCGIISILLGVIEFIFTVSVSIIGKYGGITCLLAIRSLVQMVGMNCFVFIAVLPIITFTGQRTGSFMSGVVFAFFYGFVGIFASGHGLTSLYPITAGLGLINYKNSRNNTFLCLIVLLIMIIITAMLIFFTSNKEQITLRHELKDKNSR